MSVISLLAFILDPLILVFEFQLLKNKVTYIFLELSVNLFVLDMILVPFTSSIKVDGLVKDYNVKKNKSKSTNEMGNPNLL